MEYHYCPKRKRKQRMDRINKLDRELREQEEILSNKVNVRMEFLDGQDHIDRVARDNTIDTAQKIDGPINQVGYGNITAQKAR
jgi:hypothetical protein